MAQTNTGEHGRGNALEVRGLVKHYDKLAAVDGIDLDIPRGSCLGVLGPNGAGKTTTIEMLEGLKPPTAGDIRILDMQWKTDARAIRQRIGVTLQQTDFQEKLSVRETLRLFRSFYPTGLEIETVLATVGLEEKGDARIDVLSGGQKQRLAIGCAILNEPDILFLDEPTTGLDPQARRRVWEIVENFKGRGGTVLLTTHYMEEAERLADQLIIVDRGKVIARGSPAAIIGALEAEMVVTFSLEGQDPRAISENELAQLSAVVGMRFEGANVVLSVRRTQEAIAALFQLVDAKGFAIDELQTHRPTLEDVFVSLTGKHLRDG